MSSRRAFDASGLIGGTRLLSAAGCAAVWETVLQCRAEWAERGPGFFTLGVNSYQDAVGDAVRPGGTYARKAATSNTLLASRFEAVVEAVRRALAAVSGLETWFAPDLALPGFHIFRKPALSPIGGQVHVDLQYRGLVSGGFQVRNADAVMSFTLPVVLPRSGGGLNLWERSLRTPLQRRAGERPNDVVDWPSLPHVYFPYGIGELYVHSGHHYHQIAGTPSSTGEDWRVTLQGHGYIRRGSLFLYW